MADKKQEGMGPVATIVTIGAIAMGIYLAAQQPVGDKLQQQAYDRAYPNQKKRRRTLNGLPMKGRIPLATAERALKSLGRKAQKCGITTAQLREGMEVEREHRDVTGGGSRKTAKIAAVHLCERKDYYKRLKKYVE